ncbi:disintegrin and metalloproteinase domain-containing protein 12 isoform 3 preproprotein [Homo sapiens]|uniref:ADAM metallopeptidase domain 12 n=1 Tax=Homo sapiens TaxID=9606 RepID=Q5JRP2_HUMAN|nr:disintegrin and metalloproteinase domain-containing protein 12 isoform 3 preproprotein [Homo sapiens]AGX93290.1 metalloprotease-disintegrin 12 transmembrane isoform La [Homo sapiens]|eukprot:NP_001275902.1 disintegrin and metalloproteinase domain-containing protein 12 isoform 3 preproprotein [Homo sapiens]
MAARPLPVSPARALLLALAGALLAPCEARGVSLWNQGRADEVVSASVGSGDLWIPVKSFDSKNHPEVLNIRLQRESKELIINLERNEGLIASSFTETHYLQDGTDVSLARNYTGHCYYHGHVRGYSDSAVSLSTCSGLRGLIVFENESYVLEPMKSATNRYKLFPAKKLKSVRGSCGSHHNTPNLAAKNVFPPPSQTWARRHKRETLKATKYVELVIVADNREFQRQGKDLEKVKQRLIEIANHVDKFYRPLNIRIVLVGVEVWNDMDKCSVSQDPFTSLHEFLDWRKMKLLPRKSHDNAQLVSGVYFQGTTIGMAPIMSMCTADQSGGIVMDHSDNPLGAAVTLAHELGHNFGMNHDTLDRGCSCQMAVEKGGCIMNASTGYPFPMVFSSCSRKDLETSLEKGMGVCLFNLPEVRESFGGQKCGNRFVEEGEECDCGEPEECMNRCCNATTCTLKPDAVCAHGLCCEDCQLKPAGTACRDSSNSCDLPEFCTGASPHCPANVYLHDGHSCQDVDGYCYNGICQTHEQQCVTLWGPGAKPAPGICFERVNSAGDPYGNCGKVSKSSFAKCEMRDAKCGKIQCQGGASRPVIGTNAVSIETNIPLQQGGRILCRGTHVYLGDDMPDPGLVLAGTKCADGKICLNRQCQNISVFGVHECAMQCHGRGVCNNRKNCHCEAHWAPPFCDKFGFGGSTDSGPIRQADNQGLTIGILVTILCLLAAGFVVYLKRKTLIRLLFTNKKTTIEKLRCVRPSRPPRGFQPCQAHLGHLGKGLMRKPPDSYPPKDNPRRLLQCQNVDISRPLNGLNVPQPQSTQRVLPPLHRAPRAPSVPARPLPAKPALRQAQGTCKPNPPQKPLPADPLARTTRLTHALARTPGQWETGLRLAPLRPAPQYPHQVPRSTHTAYIK